MKTNKKRYVLLLALLIAPVFFSFADEDAYLLYTQGKYQDSIDTCYKEIENHSNVVSFYVLGYSLLALGRYEEAVSQMQICLERHGKHRKVIKILGEAYYRLGENKLAQQYFEDYIRIAPNGESIAESYYFLGEIFLRYKEYQHADIAFSTALYHIKNNSFWWTRLGYSRQRAGDPEDAINAYKEALLLNPGSAEALKGLRECEGLLGP